MHSQVTFSLPDLAIANVKLSQQYTLTNAQTALIFSFYTKKSSTMHTPHVRDLVLDDVWSFLQPHAQAELRSTEKVIAARFNRACALGCVQYYGNCRVMNAAHDGVFPFDPTNAAEPKAGHVTVDLRFNTFDVGSTLTNEMIKAYSFSTLRAQFLVVTGMLHLEAIEDNFLARADVDAI